MLVDMEKDLFKYDPMRSPQWRLHRVMEMVTHRPSPLRPRRADDHPVRAYHRFLLNYVAAEGDEHKRAELLDYLPHVYNAHQIHYSPDTELRQILEALLLTDESFEKIADRIGTNPEVIEYFEQLFFNVRDRLQCRTWIHLAILGSPHTRIANKDGSLTSEQRGYVYRLFAYFGGPLVLDAVISGIGSISAPARTSDVGQCLDEALANAVQTAAAVAASTLTLNPTNAIQLMKLAVRMSNKSAKSGGGPTSDYERRMEHILSSIKFEMAEKPNPNWNELEKEFMTSELEPRAAEQLALAAGKRPVELERHKKLREQARTQDESSRVG